MVAVTVREKERIVGYIRVSLERQLDGEGLNIQRDRIASFCKKHNYELVKVFSDEGVSGGKDVAERPGLYEMMEYIKNNPIKYVVVDKPDRLSRSFYQYLFLEKEFSKLKIGVLHAAQEGLNILSEDSPEDRMMKDAMRQLMSVFAELERKMIARRFTDAIRKKAEKGNKPVGRQAFGYAYSDKDGSTVINPHQADVVRHIFQMRSCGASLSSIADELNTADSRSHFAKAYTAHNKNRVWMHQSVRLILNNDFYIGKLTHAGVKTDGNHPAIIENALWGMVHSKGTVAA